jgi:acetylornithine deacetylase/succinyl-diaminopimelate desuccinylase-like protein
MMLFGPGRIQDAHTDTENLSREALEEASRIICDLVVSVSTDKRTMAVEQL